MKDRVPKERRALACLVAGFVIAPLLCGPARAQATKVDSGPDESSQSAPPASPFKLKRGTNEFGFFAGTSLNNPTLIGTVTGERLTVVALRYGRVLGTKGGMAFEWTVDAVPAAFVSEPRFVVNKTPAGLFIVTTTHETIYGAGVSPIGLKFNFRRQHRVQPFASTTGGLLVFSKQVPRAGSSEFNFTFDFGGGVQIFTRSRRAVTLGYKFQHISNGGTASFNPGLDANVIYAGFSIFR
ncbi:MAG: acyloxyacyl hydrolase [Acidobacteriota bacterium]|nr:acyloxyacyl hydrolase [Acidobacteriota bacterium]